MQIVTRQSTTLIDTLSRLVRIPTLSLDHQANSEALDWITAQLADLPLEFKRYDNRGFPALVALSDGVQDSKNPRLWLAAHLDVIPGTVVDFEPHIKDGRLIGRGVFDMKYAIACFIHLLQELGPELAEYDLGLMITTDEEQGGERGVQWLVEDQGYRGQAVLLPECGTSWTLETAAKGIMSWQLRATGLASHASRPWNGLNAIEQIMKFVETVKSNVPPEPCGDEAHGHSTVSLGQINGGAVVNQVPDRAEGLLDIRLMPGTTLEDARSWLAAAARTVPGVEAELLYGYGAISNPLEGPAAIFAGLARDVTGAELTPTLSHGASDGRYFSAHNIPVISVPPTGGGQHSAHEWINLESLDQYYDITSRFVRLWAKSKSKN